jgi:molecular chaperone DnaJ
MRLCLRDEGEPGPHGGPRGDLYVDIQVNPHPFFQRDGQDLMCVVPITYTQAALGTTLEVPLLSGRHELKIPAGTQPNQTFVLRNEGMPNPHGGRRGSLVVQVQVEVPKKLSEQQEELLRELAKLERSEVSSHRRGFLDKLKDYFAPHEET